MRTTPIRSDGAKGTRTAELTWRRLGIHFEREFKRRGAGRLAHLRSQIWRIASPLCCATRAPPPTVCSCYLLSLEHVLYSITKLATARTRAIRYVPCLPAYRLATGRGPGTHAPAHHFGMPGVPEPRVATIHWQNCLPPLRTSQMRRVSEKKTLWGKRKVLISSSGYRAHLYRRSEHCTKAAREVRPPANTSAQSSWMILGRPHSPSCPGIPCSAGKCSMYSRDDSVLP